MDSKEKIEALNYTWFYDPTCQEEADKRETIIKELKKDLEELEELKKIMGTPIQDIMKKLRKLETIEKHFIYDDKETRFKLIKPISIEDDDILKEVSISDEPNCNYLGTMPRK